jgi:hypothetical protein
MFQLGQPHQAEKKDRAGFFQRPFPRVGIASSLAAVALWACSNPKVAETSSPAATPATNVAVPTYAEFQKTVQPFLAAHCYECHGPNDTEGDVRLDTFKDDASLAKGVPTLAKAIQMLSTRKMPPKDEPRPTEDEYNLVVAWMKKYTDSYYLSGPIDPGRVTIHRLNRVEYDNTVRDLLAIDIHPADSFPADDAGDGFDNNGDALTIAPVLFEKYIKAAEISLDAAVFTDPTVPPPSKIFDATTLEGDIPKTTPAPATPLVPAAAALAAASQNVGQNAGPNTGAGRGGPPPVLGRVFQHSGYIYVTYNFPVDGDYIFSLKGYSGGGAAGGRGNATPTANVLFYLDGNIPVVDSSIQAAAQNPDRYSLKVSARANAPQDVSSPTIHVTAGPHSITLAFRNGATLDDYNAAIAAAAAAAAAPAPAPAAPTADQVVASPATNAGGNQGAVVAVAATPSGAIAASDPAASAGGSDAAASAAPAASATPAPAGARGTAGRGNGARGFGGGRGGPPPGPPPVVAGATILGVLNLNVEGPQFTNSEDMPDRMPKSYQSVMVAHPSSTLTRAEAAEKIIRNFATRAYRRPATDEEVNKLMVLFTSVDAPDRPFEKSVTVALQAVLLNPNFLFRIEQEPQPGEPNNIHTLNDYELASRLSYFLWSSMPDDELFALAAKGQLHAHLDEQVTRMLKDPKAEALVDNFAGQWLQLRKVDDVNPDSDKFPDFSPELKSAMLKETQMFFSSIKDEDRSVLDFIDADYSFVNAPLAKLYGLDGNFTDAFQRVTFPKDSPRGGLITQASILAITSYNTRTSPVQRGKWVLENLLDSAPPPPPPNVPALADEKDLKGTLRQQMEQHRSNPACASCHERMDAIGFSLENFDPTGAWRTKDINNDPIDPSGHLPDGTTFSGAKELEQTLLASKDQFCHCLATKMLTYALGRNVESFDARTTNDIVSTMQKNGDKFSALIHAIVHSDAFLQRRGHPPGDTPSTGDTQS